MARTRIKLCGMTNANQVRQAVDLGVDAIGMIVSANSPRVVSMEQALAIRAVVPAFVSLVGVFVDTQATDINSMAAEMGLDVVQLHGDESPEILESLKFPSIKAIRARDAEAVRQGIAAFSESRAILLDPYHHTQHGGTGLRLDQSLWPRHEDNPYQARLVLAGGLSPENMFESLQVLNPFAVDLNSGVELSPGQKDMVRLAAAILEVQRYDYDSNN